jgi:predicted nuclease with TOPRIM domain
MPEMWEVIESLEANYEYHKMRADRLESECSTLQIAYNTYMPELERLRKEKKLLLELLPPDRLAIFKNYEGHIL